MILVKFVSLAGSQIIVSSKQTKEEAFREVQSWANGREFNVFFGVAPDGDLIGIMKDHLIAFGVKEFEGV